MEDHESIDQMFGQFQTIINNMRFLGKTYDNYDHITKILQNLPRQWRPQVTAPMASKELKNLLMKELLRTLKLHEIKVNEDEGQRKEAFEEEGFDENNLSFNSRKTHSLWKKKRRSKRFTKETKNKSQVMCYECKKLGYFTSKCPSLEKEKEKEKKRPSSRRRKVSWQHKKTLICLHLKKRMKK
ncbi:hypothetical protein CR513_29594, partial [Mucuna pruriens]